MDRVADLERQVGELARDVEALKAGSPRRDGRDVVESPSPEGVDAREGGGDQPDVAEGHAALEALVDVAVDRKTEKVLGELRAKADKKPAVDVFASMLDLTEAQRAAAERVIVAGQRELHRLLEVPTADGTNLMDQLVEIAARGMAEPGKDHGWGQWLARVLNEKVPGTDATYAARIEAVKGSMRASFERDWSKEQYREFLEWGVDPTEIQGVRDSPNVALVERITARARMLGANVPRGG
jgi:hypothetical protein